MADALLLLIPDLPPEEAVNVQVAVAQRAFYLGHREAAYQLMASAHQRIASIQSPVERAEILLLQGVISQSLGLNAEADGQLKAAKDNFAHIPSSMVITPEATMVEQPRARVDFNPGNLESNNEAS